MKRTSFNSTLVRFRLNQRVLTVMNYLMFQFHPGSISSVPEFQGLTLKTSVSIPPWFDFVSQARNELWQRNCGFNSTLVRFRLHITSNNTALFESFQFHPGSISSQALMQAIKQNTQFQFHPGSISSSLFDTYYSFYKEFQFHPGSISSNV